MCFRSIYLFYFCFNLCQKCQKELVASEECHEVFARLQEKGINVSMDTIKRCVLIHFSTINQVLLSNFYQFFARLHTIFSRALSSHNKPFANFIARTVNFWYNLLTFGIINCRGLMAPARTATDYEVPAIGSSSG